MTTKTNNAAGDGLKTATEAEAVRLTRFEQLALGELPAAWTHTTRKKSQKAALPLWRRVLALPAYYWVLICQLFVILPHASHLPLWLIAYALVSLVMQLPRVKARLSSSSPRKLKRTYQGIQMLGFVLGLAGLWMTYQTAFGLDVGVAFLLLCLISKLWEMYKRRDAYVVLNLSLFVCASLLLIDQGLLASVEVVLSTVMVLLAFITLNDDGNEAGTGRLRTLGILSVSAVPLLVILFLFFPRLPPLWNVQLSGQQATTGVSDSMSPGDFSELSQSTELAFRVEFASERPSIANMYWRGLVFSDFDGTTWTQHNANFPVWQPDSPQPEWLNQALSTVPEDNLNQPSQYRVILEPTQQRWLFGLDYPLARERGVGISADFTLLRWQPVTQQLRYQVMRFPQMRIGTALSEREQRINLRLPEQGNTKSRALAQELFAQAGSDPVRYIETIQAWIGRTEFRYTLSPPPLADNRIDEFLFDTKAGFCEHYSSSFTFLMRAAGIPARVVAGYQGGTLGRDGQSWEVRQMDAHAWTEVWIEGQGWVRVDPTAFVAPERIEQGMDSLTSSQGASMFGDGAAAQMSYQQFRVMQSLRRLSDQASYYWQRDIVGYDQDKQADSLLKWFNIRTLMQQVVWMVSIAIVLLSLTALIIWYRRRRQYHPADLPMVLLSKRLGKRKPDLARLEDEGVLSWLARLDGEMDKPSERLAIRELQAQYRHLRYGKLSMLPTTDAAYQQALKELAQTARKISKKG